MTTNLSSLTLRRFQDLARHHGMAPQVAKQMVAIHADHLAGLKQRHRAIQARWAEQTRVDPEFGCAALPSTLHTARRAVARFGGDTLRRTLDQTGLGSHPEIIRAFWKVGKAMENPRPATSPRSYTHEDTMRALYPSSYGNKI